MSTYTDLLMWDVKEPGGVANLYGLWDWVGMAPCMGLISDTTKEFFMVYNVSVKSKL